MAPDKVFLHKVRDEENSRFHEIWYESRARLVPSEEYIRKDALLEWAKEKKEKVNADEGDFSFGYVSAMIGLIDKIESM